MSTAFRKFEKGAFLQRQKNAFLLPYQKKLVIPFVDKLKVLIRSLLAQVFDLHRRVEQQEKLLDEYTLKAQRLADDLTIARVQIQQWSELGKDFDALYDALGPERAEEILRQARQNRRLTGEPHLCLNEI